MQTIFITGASSGLGKATAELFLARGWRVIATMRNPADGAALTAAADLAGRRGLPPVTVLPLDVTDPGQIQATVDAAIALGPIDVVFNNAGYGISGPLEATTDEQIVRQINTNLLGVIRVTKAFIPSFRARGKGLFISTTSIGGLVGFPFSSLYHAAKWGLEGWTEGLSFELAAFGIGVKTVAPGAIQTDFIGRSYDKVSHPAYDGQMDAFFAKAEGTVFAPASSIAEVVYTAATDGRKQLRYLAGEDAKALYARRQELGQDGFHSFMEEAFLNG